MIENTDFQVFTDLMQVYGFGVTECNVDQPFMELEAFGGIHTVKVPRYGQPALNISLSGNPESLKTFNTLNKELAILRNIIDSDNPAVKDLYNKLQVLMGLTNEDT